MKNSYFCGFNGFRQFGSAHATKALQPTEFTIYQSEADYLCSSSWAFNVFAHKNELLIKGFVGEEPDTCFKQETDYPVKQIACNDNYCLVLLENGEVYKLNIRNRTFDKLTCFHVESCRKRTIFGDIKEDPVDQIEHIACGTSISIAISRNNVVFNIPSKTHEFPKHEKIKSLVCGFEHALALNANGDIYSWGNGLRGQLGVSDMKTHEVPTLIEALAGIKILCISAGGWHSAAISAFGDIYTWGSNINGQLGIHVYKITSPGEEKNFRHKNPSVYPLPQVIDVCPCCSTINQQTCCPVKIISGARHTFVQNTCGRIFCTGWNKYGQLGLNSHEEFKDQFTAVDFPHEKAKILCGPWCTLFLL